MEDLQFKMFIETISPTKKYLGRKAGDGVFQQILSNIPQCDLFIDAMAGSGFISSLITGCSIVVNDIDQDAINAIRCNKIDTEFFNLDYRAIVKRFDNGNNRRVIYFDPPYMMETRAKVYPKKYRHDWGREDHTTFLTIVRGLTIPAMISHYPCPTYDKALAGWRKITYTSMTRGGARKENLYLNFPQPALLQFPGLVGANFTDRQRIKRKADRTIKKLQGLPEHERAAILSIIVENFNYVRKSPQ